MIYLLFIISVVILLLIVIYPKPLELLLRKNHYISKQNIAINYILPHIPNKNVIVLDFGSGSGALSDYISKQLINSQVIPLDIEDVHEYGKKPTIYDGYKIPYKDNTFDVVICLFVLHHIPHQDKILDELIRICKGKLLIMEDCKDSTIDNILTKIHSHSSYGQCHNCFHSTRDWIRIFKSKDVKVDKVINVNRFMLPIYPVSRKLFLLDK
jgi:ubiquinone/menaquinone biosynthesis C-methylase UbiE